MVSWKSSHKIEPFPYSTIHLRKHICKCIYIVLMVVHVHIQNFFDMKFRINITVFGINIHIWPVVFPFFWKTLFLNKYAHQFYNCFITYWYIYWTDCLLFVGDRPAEPQPEALPPGPVVQEQGLLRGEPVCGRVWECGWPDGSARRRSVVLIVHLIHTYLSIHLYLKIRTYLEIHTYLKVHSYLKFLS